MKKLVVLSLLLVLFGLSVGAVSAQDDLEPVRINPYRTHQTFDVLPGQEVHVRWGWVVCHVDTRKADKLLKMWIDHTYQNYVLSLDGEVITASESWGSSDSRWGDPVTFEWDPENCYFDNSVFRVQWWTWVLPGLDSPGLYTLDAYVEMNRWKITDYLDLPPKDGKPDVYGDWVVADGPIYINVLAE